MASRCADVSLGISKPLFTDVTSSMDEGSGDVVPIPTLSLLWACIITGIARAMTRNSSFVILLIKSGVVI